MDFDRWNGTSWDDCCNVCMCEDNIGKEIGQHCANSGLKLTGNKMYQQ